MNVQNWTGHGDPKLGYGSMLEGFLRATPKSVTFDEKASVSVHMQVPEAVKGWWRGAHRVLFTMWETDTMPDRFKPWLPHFDQILVPCQDNVELFSQYHSSVKYVPLGVDTVFWSPTYGGRPKREGKFRFHAGGSLWKRKGLDLVVQAFNNLKLPNAELHIKAAPHAFDTPSGKLGDNIFLHRQWMSRTQQRDWYAQADCFVAPARGEGFGLMPLQAIALGVPTIVSYSTGQKQFSHLATGVVSCRKSRAETVGKWDEPVLGELEEQMKTHYENRPAVPGGAQEFSWGNATKKLVAAIPKGVVLDSDEWVLPDVKVRVRALRTVNATIGKETYRLKTSQEVDVPAGVFEVLSASGAVEVA